MAIDLSTLNEPQRAIACGLDKPLFVEAGAGSGKTFTLTRRIAWALSPGSAADGSAFIDSLDQALIITFTNAAALEIKERVRSTLRENGMAEAALSVDDAWISTIHGMCSRILRRHALDLGLDPQFKMLPANLEESFRAQATELVMAQASHERRVKELARQVGSMYPKESGFGSAGLSVVGLAWQLVDLAGKSPQGYDSLYAPAADAAAPRMAWLRDSYVSFLAEKRRVCKSEKAIAEVEAQLATLNAFFELPLSEQNETAALKALTALGRGPKATSNPREEAKELQATIAKMRKDSSLAVLQDYLPELLAIARALDEAYAAYKTAGSYLDNDDLIRLCLGALKTNADLAALYSEQFRLVMVDEFQDTDQRQVELVGLLSGQGQRLCTVGDAQQSIYRFRGADVSVFKRRGATVDPDNHVRLDVNYRSHADILSFVDAIFGGLGERRGILPGFMSLSPNPARKDGYHARDLPRVYVEVARATSAANRGAVMANEVADRLAAFAAAGEDPDDMALLLGRTSQASLYVDALRDRGIKCVVTGGSTFSRLDEVKVVRALVHTLANVHDTKEGLFSLLSSEMFCLDANDFCALGTGWQEKLEAYGKRRIDLGVIEREMAPGVKASPRLARALEVLGRAFSRMGTWELADVVRAALVESGWLLRLEGQGAQGRSCAANLLAAVRYLRDLTHDLGLGVSRACSEFDLWLEVAKAHPAVLSGGKGDAVRVMTIHASKGLEFPIVAVGECWGDAKAPVGVLSRELDGGQVMCALATKDLRDGSAELPDDFSLKMDVSDFVDLAQYTGLEDEQAEKVRLLYVGITRAREAAILAIPLAEKRTSRLAAGVASVLFGEADLPCGETTLDYGGSEPAVVRCVDITVDREDKTHVLADSHDTLPGFDGYLDAYEGAILLPHAAEDAAFNLYDLPAPRPEVGFWSPREGTYSYSSAHAALEAAAEKRAAAGSSASRPAAGQAACAADAADAPAAAPAPAAPEPAPSLLAPDVPIPARVLDEDEDDASPLTADADKATNLGSAFHELAQVMALAGGLGEERVAALSRAWHLSPRQDKRLRAALDLWENSAIRAEALAWARVTPEAPFFVHAPSDFGEWLEGAIDLLCTDEAKTRALVVDYKTGDAGLTLDELRERHQMQAKFYTDVLLGLGFKEVECAFVCVEREDPLSAGQPQVVRYRF